MTTQLCVAGLVIRFVRRGPNLISSSVSQVQHSVRKQLQLRGVQGPMGHLDPLLKLRPDCSS